MRYRARQAWDHRAWKEEKDKAQANRVAQQARRAATLTAELAVQSETEVFEVCSQPPALHDEPAAERTVEPQPLRTLTLPTTALRAVRSP